MGVDRKLSHPAALPPMPDERSSACGGVMAQLPGKVPPTPHPFHSMPALPRPANLMVPVVKTAAPQGPGLAEKGNLPAFQMPGIDSAAHHKLAEVRMAELQAEQHISKQLNEAYQHICHEVEAARRQEQQNQFASHAEII